MKVTAQIFEAMKKASESLEKFGVGSNGVTLNSITFEKTYTFNKNKNKNKEDYYKHARAYIWISNEETKKEFRKKMVKVLKKEDTFYYMIHEGIYIQWYDIVIPF